MGGGVMANELQLYADPENDSGLTVLARVYDQSGTQVGTDVTCTEVGVLAIYRGDMPPSPGGEFVVRFFAGSTLLAQAPIYWDGSAEIVAPLQMKDIHVYMGLDANDPISETDTTFASTRVSGTYTDDGTTTTKTRT